MACVVLQGWADLNDTVRVVKVRDRLSSINTSLGYRISSTAINISNREFFILPTNPEQIIF